MYIFDIHMWGLGPSRRISHDICCKHLCSSYIYVRLCVCTVCHDIQIWLHGYIQSAGYDPIVCCMHHIYIDTEYIYIYVIICICIYIIIHIHACIYIYTRAYLHICIYAIPYIVDCTSRWNSTSVSMSYILSQKVLRCLNHTPNTSLEVTWIDRD